MGTTSTLFHNRFIPLWLAVFTASHWPGTGNARWKLPWDLANAQSFRATA